MNQEQLYDDQKELLEIGQGIYNAIFIFDKKKLCKLGTLFLELKKSISGCRTSQNDTGWPAGYPAKRLGKLNTACVFPFTVAGTTYYSCTYDFGLVTGHNPWCSTLTDEKGNHKSGNWGVCDPDLCSIPPRCKLINYLRLRYLFVCLI